MTYQAFCDADSLATWIFNWVVGAFILSLCTILLINIMGKIELNLKRRDLLKKQEYYLQMKVEIFEAAIVAKDKAYNDYESATSWHDKAKALYMFEIIERCLDKFTVVHIDKKD